MLVHRFLPSDQLEQLRATYLHFDALGTGRISAEVFEKLFREIYKPPFA